MDWQLIGSITKCISHMVMLVPTWLTPTIWQSMTWPLEFTMRSHLQQPTTSSMTLQWTQLPSELVIYTLLNKHHKNIILFVESCTGHLEINCFGPHCLGAILRFCTPVPAIFATSISTLNSTGLKSTAPLRVSDSLMYQPSK